MRKGELQFSGPRMGLTIAIPESAGAEGVLGRPRKQETSLGCLQEACLTFIDVKVDERHWELASYHFLHI